MPKVVDHDERRLHIVDAVTQIIIRDGFDRVTMREIATEAGYAHGAIQRYFPNKQSLLTAAFLKVFNDSHEQIERACDGVRGLDALSKMSELLLPFSTGEAERSKLVLTFWDRAAQDPEMFDIHHDNIVRRRQMIRTYLEQAREDGELRADADIENEVNRISTFNAGWQMLSVLVPEASGDDMLQASIDTMIDNLRA